MHCDWDVVTLSKIRECVSEAYLEQARFLATCTERNLASAKSGKKRGHFNLIAGQLALSLWTCNAQRCWQELKMGSYLFTTSHTSHTMPPPFPSYFLASHTRPPLLSHFCSVATSLLSTSHDAPPPLLPSLTVPFPLVLLPSCCGKHARALTFSSFLSTSLTLSLLLSFPLPLPCLHFLCVLVSLPFFSVSLHAGDWNVSSLCLRSWGGLPLEKYQSKKYSLTVNRSHCRAEWFNKTTRPWYIRGFPA